MRCNSVKESEIKVQLKLKMSSVVAFNMSASMEKAMVGLGRDLCVALGEKYGFDGTRASLELGVSVTTGAKKVGGKAVKKTPSSVRAQPSIPLPFTGTIREDCCIGVKQNHGLYTQCFSGASSAGETGLCKGCAKQASKNASGEPDCGLIAKRVMQGSEYRDSKGRAPVHYTKVMKKQKLSEEQVLGEAAKFGIEIDASHFAIPQAQQKRGRPKKATTSDTESENSSSAADATGEKKTRGRPKKAAKVVEVSETEDLFASLMQQAQSASPRPSASLVAGGGSAADEMSDVSCDSESDSESKGSKKKAKKSKEESEEELAEKAAKFLQKQSDKDKKALAQQEKALAQQEKEAEKALKLAEKEKAQQEKALKLAEKEADKVKKAAEKEQAQQEKALAQQKKLAEKAAEKPKKAQAQQEKAQAQQEKAKKTKKAEEPAKPVEPVADLESEAESEDDTSEAEEPVVAVKKFEYQGVTYLKSGDGILYHAKSQEVVGKWNEKTQTIDVYDGGSDSDEDSDSDDE